MKTEKEILRERNRIWDLCWRLRHEIHMRDSTFVKEPLHPGFIKRARRLAKKMDRENPVILDGKPLEKVDLDTIGYYAVVVTGQLQALNYVSDNKMVYNSVEEADADT